AGLGLLGQPPRVGGGAPARPMVVVDQLAAVGEARDGLVHGADRLALGSSDGSSIPLTVKHTRPSAGSCGFRLSAGDSTGVNVNAHTRAHAIGRQGVRICCAWDTRGMDTG